MIMASKVIKFKAKAYKQGASKYPSFVLVIPSQYIKDGVVDPKKELEVQIKEGKK